MVIGAEDVDRPVEAASELVGEIGDVRRPICRPPALLRRADQHPVLLVSVLGGASPDRSVLLVGVDARKELGEPLLELALKGPRVEVHAEALECRLDALEHPRHRVAGLCGEVRDVRAAIALLGRLLSYPDSLHGFAEQLHLPSRVVVVVLSHDDVARERQETGDGVAVSAVAGVRDSEGPRRVRGHHLDLHALGRGREAAAEGLGLEDRAQRVDEPFVGDTEVHEPRTRDVRTVDETVLLHTRGDLGGDLAGRPPLGPGPLQGDRRRVVPVNGIRRALELDGSARDLAQCLREPRDRVQAAAPLGAKSCSSLDISSVVPTPMTTSPCSNTASEVGVTS